MSIRKTYVQNYSLTFNNAAGVQNDSRFVDIETTGRKSIVKSIKVDVWAQELYSKQIINEQCPSLNWAFSMVSVKFGVGYTNIGFPFNKAWGVGSVNNDKVYITRNGQYFFESLTADDDMRFRVDLSAYVRNEPLNVSISIVIEVEELGAFE